MGRFDGWDRALEAGDPLEVLKTAVTYQQYLEAAKRAAARAASAQGATWDQVAAALGTSPQSAWDRYHHATSAVRPPVERERRSPTLRLRCPACGAFRQFDAEALFGREPRGQDPAEVEVRTPCEACGDDRSILIAVPRRPDTSTPSEI